MNAKVSKIVLRRSTDRWNGDYGWLKTFHSFATSAYHAPDHEQFGSLRVINDDRVAPYKGFGAHSHAEFEIFSYIIDGELEHNDSMGNTEILKRGDLQLTSAGTGISHSEKTHGPKEVHFIQVWSFPSKSGLKPRYFTRHFTDLEKQDKWARVVAPVGAEGVDANQREANGPAPIQSPLTLFATLISPGTRLSKTMVGEKGYIQVIQRSGYNTGPASGASVKVSVSKDAQEVLREGDAAYMFIGDELDVLVENVGQEVAEILLFDLE